MASNWYIRNRVAGGVINLGVETTGGALYYPISISGTGDTTKFRNSTGEMARFDANGRLLVGKTSQVYTTVGVQLGNYSSNSIDNTTQFTHNNSGGTSVACTAPVSESCITFHRQDTGAFMGHIRNDSSNSVSYFTSSDERLKENIVDAPSASDDIDAIQIRSFDWKADGSHQKYGVIAQELNNVIPSAVDMTQDENRHASVDLSKLVPMLVKEIQSLRAELHNLKELTNGYMDYIYNGTQHVRRRRYRCTLACKLKKRLLVLAMTLLPTLLLLTALARLLTTHLLMISYPTQTLLRLSYWAGAGTLTWTRMLSRRH